MTRSRIRRPILCDHCAPVVVTFWDRRVYVAHLKAVHGVLTAPERKPHYGRAARAAIRAFQQVEKDRNQ